MFQDPNCLSTDDCLHIKTGTGSIIAADTGSSFQLSEVGDVRLPLHTITVDVRSSNGGIHRALIRISIEQVSPTLLITIQQTILMHLPFLIALCLLIKMMARSLVHMHQRYQVTSVIAYIWDAIVE